MLMVHGDVKYIYKKIVNVKDETKKKNKEKSFFFCAKGK